MNINILNGISRTIGRTSLKLRKHSPEILVVGGVIGFVTSAVMACKATTKLNDILEESRDELDQIHGYIDEHGYTERYTEEDSKKDLAIVYTQSAVKIAKLYGPSVILGAVSISAILGGHNILRKRNIALAAAYKALDVGFKEYRGRVIDRFGKELDRELKYGIQRKEIEETEVGEDGTETVTKKEVDIADPNGHSIYARFFDDGCTGWEKDPEHNLVFLKGQQSWANEVLKRKGHLFLNEVYDMLGIPRTAAGQVVGWIYDDKNPVGDNFVDFGIYDLYNERSRAFVNGYEKTILLDFNVDGNILDLI